MKKGHAFYNIGVDNIKNRFIRLKKLIFIHVIKLKLVFHPWNLLETFCEKEVTRIHYYYARKMKMKMKAGIVCYSIN